MSEKLNQTLETYKVLSVISQKAHRLSRQNPKYITEFNLPIAWKKSKNPAQVIDTYFDKLNGQILEYAFLELLSKFEAIVIDKIKNASGNMKQTLSINYELYDFRSCTDRFVKTADDFSSLNRIVLLLENKISPELFASLKEMVKYRDRLAHGKRFNNEIILNNLEESIEVLNEILNEIT